MELVNDLLKIGFVRCSDKGFVPFPKYGYYPNILPHIEVCACGSLFQKSSIALLCPITSIIFGVGRLYDVLKNKRASSESKLKLSYFIITGIISAVGLGALVLLIRIVSTFMRLLFGTLASIVFKLNPRTSGLPYYKDPIHAVFLKLDSVKDLFTAPTEMPD